MPCNCRSIHPKRSCVCTLVSTQPVRTHGCRGASHTAQCAPPIHLITYGVTRLGSGPAQATQHEWNAALAGSTGEGEHRQAATLKNGQNDTRTLLRNARLSGGIAPEAIQQSNTVTASHETPLWFSCCQLDACTNKRLLIEGPFLVLHQYNVKQLTELIFLKGEEW